MLWCSYTASSLLNSAIKAGNKVKTTSSAVSTPITMIQPKEMMGDMPLTSSEAKATIVVSAVYRQGFHMDSTAWRNSLPCSEKRRVARNCR